MRKTLARGFCAALAALAMPAHAADEDANIWLAATGTTPVADKLSVTLEVQMRFTDDASRLGQTNLRPSLGVKLDNTTTASLGYAWVHSDPIGPVSTDEHRIWQQIAYRLAGDGKTLTLTGRSRLEQRFIEDASDMGWRFRQQLRATAPLTGKIRVVGWSEVFYAVDDTSWGQRSGVERWRNFAGVSVPVSKAVSIEPGYLNQWIFRPGPDRVNHIASISLAAQF